MSRQLRTTGATVPWLLAVGTLATLLFVPAGIRCGSLAPTPAPTFTPPPSGNRPFAAPATTRVVNVPSSIDATGATDVGSALQSFINGQPDGSVITFPVNGVYRLSTGIRLDSRHDLIFDGRGTTIRTTGSGGSALSSPFVLSWASSNTDIWIRNFVLEGNNTRTGAAIYDGAQESQMGIDLNGGARIELSGLTIRRMNGDGLYANENTPTAGSATAWPTDIWFHDSSIDSVGRNAFTINSGRRVTLERNVIDHVGGSVLDIEPDLDTQGAVDLILRNNTVGAWGLSPKYTMHFVACANNAVGDRARSSAASTSPATASTRGRPEQCQQPRCGGLSRGSARPARPTSPSPTTSPRGPAPGLSCASSTSTASPSRAMSSRSRRARSSRSPTRPTWPAATRSGWNASRSSSSCSPASCSPDWPSVGAAWLGLRRRGCVPRMPRPGRYDRPLLDPGSGNAPRPGKLLVESGELRHESTHPERRRDSLAGRRTERLAQVGVAEEPQQRGRQGIAVIDRDEQPGLPIEDDLA